MEYNLKGVLNVFLYTWLVYIGFLSFLFDLEFFILIIFLVVLASFYKVDMVEDPNNYIIYNSE